MTNFISAVSLPRGAVPARSPDWSALALLAFVLLPAAARAQNVTELYVTPDTLNLKAGERRGLTVQAFDDAGNVILAVRYKSADTLVAQVGENGTVTAIGGGRTRVTVTAGKKSRSVLVVVTGGAVVPPAVVAVDSTALLVARLVAAPAAVALLPTERTLVAVTAFRADSTPLPAPRLVWKSMRPEVVSVGDTSGMITGLATGQGAVEAGVPGGVTVRVPVTVALATLAADHGALALAPGGQDTVGVRVPSQGGRRLRPDDLLWRVGNQTVAEVTDQGVVRAIAPGETELVVGGFLQELRIPLTVHPAVAYFLASPRVTEPVRLPVSVSREFTVQPHAADSVAISGVPILWTVSDTAIATFDTATRRLTARAVGAATLTFAARGFIPKAWTIQVIAGTIGFQQARPVLRPGERLALKPGFVDDSGRVVAPAQGLDWGSSDTAIAVVSGEGVVDARRPGRVLIRAALPGGPPVEAQLLVTGDLIASVNRGGRFGIYALALGAPDLLIPLLADSGQNLDGAYSPDRLRIAFASDRAVAGNFDIFVADADGRRPVRLTTDPAPEGQPVWAPDGKRLVFVSSRSGTRQLYTISAEGGEVRALTSLPHGAEDPAVSPDGRTVAFTGFPSGRDKPSDIYTVPVEGGTAVAATASRDRREARPLYLPGGELAWIEQPRDRKEPDLIARRTAAGTPVVLASAEGTITDGAIARDGSVVAWVVTRPDEKDRKITLFALRFRVLATGAENVLRLPPGERITSPAF